MTKVRTWTDRSGTFKVEAQFIGLKDGKIHLHKLNGIKIAVPVAKMAVEDLEYVERMTGESLDEDKPVSEIIKRSHSQKQKDTDKKPQSGAHIEKKPEYDWFDFFLRCGVSPYQCERYSFNFNKDSMDENVLEDITPEVLRNLGLKEGDVLRVMKYLDTKYGRTGGKSKLRNVSFGGEEVMGSEENAGGLFTGPGGTLKNNTRKARPAPPVQTNDVVDSKLLQQKSEGKPELDKEIPESPEAPRPPAKDKKSGFDDDAWDVKPTKQKSDTSPRPTSTGSPTPAATSAPPAPKPVLTGAMKELSLLDEPLIPVVTHSGANQESSAIAQQTAPQATQPISQSQSVPPQQPQQLQGATPALFNQLVQQPTGLPQSISQIMPQQIAMPRQRPQAPQMPTQTGSILPPPPTRPLSAPQNPPSGFAPPPLQPQLTGVGYQNPGYQNQVVSPTQTLNDLNRLRLQAQLNPPQVQPGQFTGFAGQNPQFAAQPLGMQPTGFGQPMQPLQGHMTGIQPQNPYVLGQQAGSPFADPRAQQAMQPQIASFQPGVGSPPFYQPIGPQPTGSINSVLSPPLQPQVTGLNGLGGLQNRPAFGQPPPPVPPIPQSFGGQQIPSPPPIPQSQPIAPLQPQKTGPAPNVKFGIQPEATKKLVPQPTGKRANLSQASKSIIH
jgi:actin cytoskeleton-regulatory complex protein SLA1